MRKRLPARPAADCTVDPRYEEEVSGCTATVGIVTHDKIYVVCWHIFLTGKCFTDQLGQRW